MNSDQWRELVGRHLEARRIERGFSSRYQICDGVDLSESWVRQMESGEVKRNDGETVAPNPRGNKVRILMEQLGWPADALDLLLAGTPADDLPTVDHPEDADPMEKGMAQLLEEFKRGNARLEARIEQLERAVREQGSAPHGQ